MAIVQNFWLKKSKKRLAGAVLYQAMGQTRSRELASEVSNPRTTSQMTQRTKWANLVNFYRANANWMKFAYETKKQSQTDYNKFMSLNVPNSRIYLPKQLANQGACVVDAYQMTQGSLSSIEITPLTGGWATNINLIDSSLLNSESTIGEFSQQIIPSNPAVREGDQLSFIRITQQTNATTGIPYVVVRKYEVILNSSDIRRFYDFMPEDYIKLPEEGQEQVLHVADSGLAGGFLLILSRTVGGRTYVSTQNIVVANNTAMINTYSSANALQTAIDSYGESSEPFLTSTTAESDSQAAVRPSILAVKIGNVTKTPPTIWQDVRASANGVFEVDFSGDIVDTLEKCVIIFYSEGVRKTLDVTSVQYGPGAILGTLPQNINGLSGATLSEVQAIFEESIYRAIFIVPDSDSGGSLE